MTRNLYTASRQWATRPDDERFETIEDLAEFCEQDRSDSAVSNVRLGDIRFTYDGDNDEVLMIGETGSTARMTSYAFGQTARSVGAPPSTCGLCPR